MASGARFARTSAHGPGASASRGVTDLCEFFKGYGIEPLRELTTKPTVAQSHYHPLDLTIETSLHSQPPAPRSPEA